MNAYSGLFALHYDLIYGKKLYSEEAKFIKNLVSPHLPSNKARLLDLACGTGSHAISFEQLGFEVQGFDSSQDVLNIAIQKAKSKVLFECRDMANFEVREPVDVITCLFDSIGYLQSNEAIARCLSSIKKALKKKGLLIIEFWHAPAMLKHYEPIRVNRWPTKSGHLLRISESELDVSKQLCHVKYELFEHRADGSYESHREMQTNRYFFIPEMKFFLESLGFKILEVLPAYRKDTTIDASVWHVLMMAQKESQS